LSKNAIFLYFISFFTQICLLCLDLDKSTKLFLNVHRSKTLPILAHIICLEKTILKKIVKKLFLFIDNPQKKDYLHGRWQFIIFAKRLKIDF